MNLKGQDILVLLKVVAIRRPIWSYNGLAVELGMSPSEVHAAVRRAKAARLAVQNGEKIVPSIRNLEEFLIYGVKYVFVPDRGALTRGMPTVYAAPPLNNMLMSSGEPPPVWPDPEGDVRGTGFSPIYKAVPKAARRDQQLYELLVLVDAIRGGQARERGIAVSELKERLRNYGKAMGSKY